LPSHDRTVVMALRSNSGYNTQVKTWEWDKSKERKGIIQLVKCKEYKRVSTVYIWQVWGGTGAEWAGVEWNYSGMDGFWQQNRNNLGLSSCAVPWSAIACVVTYFRRTELLLGVQERSGMN